MGVQPVHANKSPHPARARALWICVFAVLAAALVPVAGQQPVSGSPPPSSPPAAAPACASGSTAQADPGVQAAVGQTPDAANAGQQKQAVQETESLLSLATNLKAEVDKTTMDTLSVAVIRKADEIERLAHAAREKAKLTAQAKRGGAL